MNHRGGGEFLVRNFVRKTAGLAVAARKAKLAALRTARKQAKTATPSPTTSQ